MWAGPADDGALRRPRPWAATGSNAEVALAFAETYRVLSNRNDMFSSLPMRKLEFMPLQHRLNDIGNIGDPSARR